MSPELSGKLNDGSDSTLGNYRIIATALFGPESGAIRFLDNRIAEQGANQPVIADESQMLLLLAHFHTEVPS